MVRLAFFAGTLEIHGLPADTALLPDVCCWDPRSACHRGPASSYAAVALMLHRRREPWQDDARAYGVLDADLRAHREARPFQRDAISAWQASGCRGVVVLPTGAGKSHVAVMAIDDRRRAALVVAPTLDLVRQWYDLLRSSFGCEVGVVGGGDHRVEALTVTTYDSAWMHMEHLGNRFGLIIFDECHHLPGTSYALAARFCLAPFRLGLSATPERADGREVELDELIGPTVFRRDIDEMSGDWLAEYETVRVVLDLSPAERAEYDASRARYRDFVVANGIRMGGPNGWGRFLRAACRSSEGRAALAAFRRQRELAFTASAKLDYLEHLLHLHRDERALIFTDDNATAYAISQRFLVPVITHQTRVTERSRILERIRDGRYSAVVTSRVLNEGVDVPDASVAVVVSGSGSVREHVQRLGRVLRKRGDKRAVLYELISADTSEQHTSERRRDHVAWREAESPC